MSLRLTPANTGASYSRASTASTASAASTTSTASSVLAASLAAGAASVSSTVAAAWSACGRRVRTTKTKLRRRLSARGQGSRAHSSRRAGPYWSLDSGARHSVVIYLGEEARGEGRGDDAAKDRKKGAAKTDRVVVRSYAVSADDDDDDVDDCDDDDCYAYTWTNEASKSAAAAAVASALAAYRTVAGPDDYDKNWI